MKINPILVHYVPIVLAHARAYEEKGGVKIGLQRGSEHCYTFRGCAVHKESEARNEQETIAKEEIRY